MAPSSQEWQPPGKPGRFNPLFPVKKSGGRSPFRPFLHHPVAHPLHHPGDRARYFPPRLMMKGIPWKITFLCLNQKSKNFKTRSSRSWPCPRRTEIKSVSKRCLQKSKASRRRSSPRNGSQNLPALRPSPLERGVKSERIQGGFLCGGSVSRGGVAPRPVLLDGTTRMTRDHPVSQSILGSMRSPVEATRCSGMAPGAELWNADRVSLLMDC